MSEPITMNANLCCHAGHLLRRVDEPCAACEQVAALIKERDAQFEECREWETAAHLAENQVVEKAHEIADLRVELERLRAEQRIPPGMTAERVRQLLVRVRHFADWRGSDEDAVFLRSILDWLRKQAEPGTAQQSPAESSSMPEAKAGEQAK